MSLVSSAARRRSRPTGRPAGVVGALVVALVAALVAAACSSHAPTARVSASASPSGRTGTQAAAQPPARQVTLSFSGDILAHSPVNERAAVNGRSSGRTYDFRPMFARVKPLLSATDLAICHQETPLLPSDKGVSGYPVFNSPPEIADAVKDAGFDGCSTASNHAYDRGPAGVTSTLAQFDRVGVAHVGTARTASERAKPEVHTVRGVQIALLDYT